MATEPRKRGRQAALEQLAGKQAAAGSGAPGGGGFLSPSAGGGGGPGPAFDSSPTRGGGAALGLGLERTTFAERVADVKDSVEKARHEYRNKATSALGTRPGAGPSSVTSALHHKFADLEALWGEVMDYTKIDPWSQATPAVKAAASGLARNRHKLDKEVDFLLDDLWDGVSGGQARGMRPAARDNVIRGVLELPGMGGGRLSPQRQEFGSYAPGGGYPQLPGGYQSNFPGASYGAGYDQSYQGQPLGPGYAAADHPVGAGYDGMGGYGQHGHDQPGPEPPTAHFPLALPMPSRERNQQAMQQQQQQMQQQMVQFGDPPPAGAQDFETRRQLEIMRQDILRLEEQVLLAVEAEEAELPPPPPLMHMQPAGITAMTKAHYYEDVVHQIKEAHIGCEGDSGGTMCGSVDDPSIPLIMPPRDGMKVRAQIEALQKDAEQLKELTVHEFGGTAARQRMADMQKEMKKAIRSKRR